MFRTDMSKKALKFAAPFARNDLQKYLKLYDLVALDVLKKMLVDLESVSAVCRCLLIYQVFKIL